MASMTPPLQGIENIYFMRDKNMDFILDGKEEELKIKVGGILYENCHKFPPIIINEENKEEYLNYFETVLRLSSHGTELMLMFAEIVSIFGKDTKNSIDKINSLSDNFFMDSISCVALSLNQTNEILNKIKSLNSESIILDGYKYVFIIKLISNLFSYYSHFIIHLISVKYIDNETFVRHKDGDITSKTLGQMLTFLMSDEVEKLRKFFKVHECYNSVREEHTIH